MPISASHTLAGSTTTTPGPNPAILAKCEMLKVSRCVTPCIWQTATRRASWTCLPMTPSSPTRAFHAGSMSSVYQKRERRLK